MRPRLAANAVDRSSEARQGHHSAATKSLPSAIFSQSKKNYLAVIDSPSSANDR